MRSVAYFWKYATLELLLKIKFHLYSHNPSRLAIKIRKLMQWPTDLINSPDSAADPLPDWHRSPTAEWATNCGIPG